MRFVLFTLLLFTFSVQQYGQNHWKIEKSFPSELDGQREMSYLPTHFLKTSLHLEELKESISDAPLEFSGSRKTSYIELPMPDGQFVTYKVLESPCMQPGLAAKYSSIKTFKAISEDGYNRARFDLGPYGFHAVINTPQGEIYIDPYVTTDQKYYITYFTKDNNEPTSLLPACGTTGQLRDEFGDLDKTIGNRDETIDLHVFKMALACTGEWGAVRGTVEKALADMVTSVNRLNQIYENEFGSRFILIDNNDNLIHLNSATDPYPIANEGRELLGINTTVINTILGGSGSYDLGHVYTLSCTDVGGVAMLGSLCAGNKGAGVTCHYANLLHITVQVAAHEIGHQLGAAHTFNNCQDDGNESFSNGFEPGGGSTIMSYANLCGTNSFVSSGSDDYYNQASLIQIYNISRYTNSGAFGCSDKVATSNVPPTAKITTMQNLVIPTGTSFVIEGEGSDANNDAITYCFEQKDASFSACPIGNPSGSCPLFRSYPPNNEPFRIFPSRSTIFSGQTYKAEILPAYGRDMNFILTVRDNNAEAGIATWTDLLRVKVDGGSGPFRVIYPNIGESFKQGEKLTVKWEVANSDKAPVNCKKVDIYLSQKNALRPGEEGMTLLVPNSDNDGAEEVIIPNVPIGTARIVVRASDNIFFDVSNFNCSITAADTPTAYFKLDKYSDDLCLPAQSTLPISTEGIGGFNGMIDFTVGNLPEGVTAQISETSVPAGSATSINFDVLNSVPTGSYVIEIQGIGDNGDTINRSYLLNVISTDFSDLGSILPLDGEKNAEGPTFTWNKAHNGTSYQIEIATDASFVESSLLYNEMTTDTFFKAPSTFPKKMVYFWRVKTSNSCGESSYTQTKIFGTAALTCNTFTATGLPINLSSTGKPSIESSINVPLTGSISDINITNLSLDHDNFADLSAYLISPSGTSVKMFGDRCPKKWNVSFSLDDQAPLAFSCSTTNGNQFRPQEALSKVNGEEINGVWKLKIDDNAAGNGGKLNNFVLELCGAIALSEPALIRNEVLQIQPGNKPTITNAYLAVEDAENGPNELTYTVTTNVGFGRLQKSGLDLAIGSKFTQSDINNGSIRYIQEGETTVDGFYFIVEDGTGSWIGSYRFSIEIDENFPSAVADIKLDQDVEVFPNPAMDYFNLRLSNAALKLDHVTITDMFGRRLLIQKISQSLQRIPTTNLNEGVYLIRVTNGKDEVVKKLVIAGK